MPSLIIVLLIKQIIIIALKKDISKKMPFIIDISRFFNQNFCTLWCIALFLGSWTVFAELYRLIHFIYAKLIRKRKNLQQRYGKNSWALITGSSQGIGKAFALALAKQNFNIILTARTQQKLKQTQQQIKLQFPQIQVKYIVVDFIKTCDKQKIESTWYKQHNLDNLNISIVINNAGIDYLNKLNGISLSEIVKLIQLDCFFVNSLQYLFLEKWVNNRSSSSQSQNLKKNKKNSGNKKLIINVASLCAEMPISYFAAYNAAKIYVDRLTQACALQYPQIDFMSLRPSQVSTKMTAFKKDIFTIEPHQCVEPLLDDLGYQNVSHGNFFHAMQAWLYTAVPLWFFNILWQGIFVKQFIAERKKFAQKK